MDGDLYLNLDFGADGPRQHVSQRMIERLYVVSESRLKGFFDKRMIPSDLYQEYRILNNRRDYRRHAR